MGAVRMRIQTADKNITIIHTAPVPHPRCMSKVKNVLGQAGFLLILLLICVEWNVPVAQWLEHCVSSAKVVGSIPTEHILTKKNCIAWMHCKSLWIKASAKCINVNVNVWIIERFLSAVWTLILTAPIHCRGSNWWYNAINIQLIIRLI